MSIGPVARAQVGVLRGVVNDSTGAPVVDADVGIVSLHRLARTDARGHFSIDRLPLGKLEVSIRRLGYKPQTQTLSVTDAVTVAYTIVLVGQPSVLEGMDVTEKRRRVGIEEFYERRTRGIGKFVTRDELLAREAHLPSDGLRSMPGIRFVRTGNGQGIRFVTPSNARRDCMPPLWIDGQLARSMELDDIPVNDIEGIEIYQSLSTTPAQFARGSTTPCGTLVVWTRTPGT